MDNAVTPVNVTPTEQATPDAPKPRRNDPKYDDRIRITADAVKRLRVWSEQMSDRLRGVTLTRSDLVNFLILNHPEALSPLEIRGLQAQHYDEVKLVQWALEELVAAKARGDDVTFHDIMAQYKLVEVSAPRSRRRSSDNSKNIENSRKNTTKKSHSTEQDSPISVDKPTEK